MLRMEEAVSGADEQALQHFLSNTTWDEEAVMAQVARDVDGYLGGQADSCLILDESGFPKKGEHSVGVARQYCGQVGKIDNCQVAVFGVLSCGERASLVDGRLYLPKEWIGDRKRCRKAGIPAGEYRTERTKHSLALEIVRAAKARGLRYRWVGCDAFYGKSPHFPTQRSRLSSRPLSPTSTRIRSSISRTRAVPEPSRRGSASTSGCRQGQPRRGSG